MARLPLPGNDDDIWGDVLNQYLLVGHNADGKHDIKSLLNVPAVNGQIPITDTSSSTGFVWQTGGSAGDPIVGGDLSGSASNAQIVAGAVGTNELATTSVTAVKIANTTITDAQISASAGIAQSKVANLTTDLSAKAPLASPTFTGAVTVPTPSNPTDATTKAYVDTAVAGGGSGEANTASNVGVSGVGVFKQKTGANLEFKNINAASNKITIANDSGNNEIDINISEANFSGIPESAVTNLITDLSGKVSKTGDTMSGVLAVQPVSITTPANTDGLKAEILYSPSSSGTTRVKGVVGRVVLGGSNNLTNISSQIGVEGLAENLNTGTVASLVGLKALSSNFTTGTVTELTGLEISSLTNNGGGTVTSAYGVLIDTPDLAGGASTGTASGLYVRSQSGATANYAIYTNLGTVRFGDTLSMATNKIINLGDPTNAQEAATKSYVDNKVSKLLPYTSTGNLAVRVGTHRIYNDSGLTWTIISIRASVGAAPTGSSVILDVNKNGTTIFTTQANRPTITTSTNTSGKITNMSVTTVANGDYITVDIDQIGSTISGADLTLQLEIV